MKLINLFIMSCFISVSARADLWICDVQEKPDTQMVFNTANETLWLQTASQKTDLITSERISSWQMSKNKCDVRASYDHSDKYNMYTVTYRCSFKIGGSFEIDFQGLEGYYLEDLYQGGNRNLYNFKNCRISHDLAN